MPDFNIQCRQDRPNRVTAIVVGLFAAGILVAVLFAAVLIVVHETRGS